MKILLNNDNIRKYYGMFVENVKDLSLDINKKINNYID